MVQSGMVVQSPSTFTTLPNNLQSGWAGSKLARRLGRERDQNPPNQEGRSVEKARATSLLSIIFAQTALVWGPSPFAAHVTSALDAGRWTPDTGRWQR